MLQKILIWTFATSLIWSGLACAADPSSPEADASPTYEQAKEGLDRFLNLVAELRSHIDASQFNLEAAGTTKFVEEYGTYDMFAASHVFGTCRMGADPGESVVDADCRSHRWRNLLITDASVFPSSGGGEGPSLTIYANALRAVEKMTRINVNKINN